MELQKSIILPVTLAVLISAGIFGSGGYYLGNNQDANSVSTVTPTAAAVNDSRKTYLTAGWREYTFKKLQTGDTSFSFLYPPAYTDPTSTQDLYTVNFYPIAEGWHYNGVSITGQNEGKMPTIDEQKEHVKDATFVKHLSQKEINVQGRTGYSITYETKTDSVHTVTQVNLPISDSVYVIVVSHIPATELDIIIQSIKVE